ncbi:hypothetical protein HOP50_04g29260 [Chloropicon primus]|nr:hypothetical protein HOP50_04g29260 [Chloropicon primus]
MPKLSSFVKKRGGSVAEGKGSSSSSSTLPPPSSSSKASASGVKAQAAKAGSSRAPKHPAPDQSQSSEPRPDIGIPKKALGEYIANRVFRWPDGTLRRDKPPAKRSVVVARKEWEDIVTFCRRTGGCTYCAQGKCLLHGFGVSPEEHEKYLREMGLWNQPLKDVQEQIYMEEQGLRTAQVS